MTGASYILHQLKELGIEVFFGVPGLQVDPLYIASLEAGITPIINCHELSAGYMATGYSLANEKLGVVVAIGNPGSSNLIGAVSLAKQEKVPLLIVTGDVPVSLKKGPGFQSSSKHGSNDDVIFTTITKFSCRVTKPINLAETLQKAIKKALTPPYGPSHVIVPHDILNLEIEKKKKLISPSIFKDSFPFIKTENISELENIIISQQKVVFWAGTSLSRKYQSGQLIELASKFHIPIVTTYGAKGIIDERNTLCFGNFGFAGSVAAHHLLFSNEVDAVIVFDVEQNERNSANWDPRLYKNKRFYFINFPKSFRYDEVGTTIEFNPFEVLQQLYTDLLTKSYDTTAREKWLVNIKKTIRKEWDPLATEKRLPENNIETGRLVKIVQEELPDDISLFVDSGNHRVFPGMLWKAKKTESFFSAETTAPLGWAICAGIGFQFASKKPLAIITGDGCMQMHGLEIKTAIKYGLPILIIVVNNNSLGSIKLRYSKKSFELGNIVDITEIDWTQFVKSMNGEAYDIFKEQELRDKIGLFLRTNKTIVLNVRTPYEPLIQFTEFIKAAY